MHSEKDPGALLGRMHNMELLCREIEAKKLESHLNRALAYVLFKCHPSNGCDFQFAVRMIRLNPTPLERFI